MSVWSEAGRGGDAQNESTQGGLQLDEQEAQEREANPSLTLTTA